MFNKLLLLAMLICIPAQAATLAEMLADGYPMSAVSITPTKGSLWVASGSSFIPVAVGTNGQFLTADSSQTSGVKWAAAGAGAGSVTNVSVVSANGFAGSVATSDTTPAITLSTTITGILKGNGTAISAATSGTDYGLGTVTSVAMSGFTTGIFSTAGSPVTSSGTLAVTITGTSGGIPYFSSTSALSSSALLAANQIVLGGGAATTPATLGGLGTTSQVLIGNAAGAPSWGGVTSAMITDSTIVNADISASAAIAGTKISPAFGSQNITASGTLNLDNGFFSSDGAGNLSAVGLTVQGSAGVIYLGSTSGSATVKAPAIAGTGTAITLPNANSVLPIFGQQITFAGPSAARTITFPNSDFTAARTDAANTFTGHQTIEGVTSTGATGTGKFVFDTAPTLGAITVTSVNKVSITAPTTSSTLVIADGKSATFNASIVFTGTDITTMTFPTTSATIARTDAANTFTGASTASAWVLTSPTITTKISPTSDDGAPLGDTTHNFSDLFLATGAVINFQNSNVVVTHSSGILTMGTGELRITTPGTNSASVPSISSTSTITNKRNQPRIVSTTSYTTDTGTSLDVSTTDIFVITAQAGALKFNNPSGTPVQGEKLVIRIKDSGSARALTYDTQFRGSSDLALPTTTTTSKTLYMLFIYNSTDTKFDLLAKLDNF